MSDRDKLWYLISGLIDGSYAIKVFCREFTMIYNLEIDYDTLSDVENFEFSDLCEMAGRFSDDREELEIPNMYFSEQQIKTKAEYIVKMLKKEL